MRFWFLIFLFYSQVSLAQRTLSRESFMVNVRPVLQGILSDFYQMITLFPDFPRELIPIMQELDTLTADKEALRDNCPRFIDMKCKASVDSLRAKLSKIRLLSLNLLRSQKTSSSLHLSSLSGQRLITEFDLQIEKVKGELDNASFLMTAKIPQRKETYTILKELDEFTTMLSLSVVEYVPYLYKDDFKHVFFNFIHPIQLQISKNKNYEFLNRNVNSLNFSINLLNMNLTKRKKTPEGMGPYLNTIHNRWNSLLRYYW